MTIANQVIEYVSSAVAVYGAYAFRHVGSFLKEKVGEKRLSNASKDLQIAEQQIVQKKGIAYDAVRFAQDAYKTLGGSEKLDGAVSWASNKAKLLGVTVSPKELEDEIRIAYQDLAPHLLSVGTAVSDGPKTEEQPQEEPQPVEVPAPEPPKPVTEMTSSDIKDIVTQVVQDHLQPNVSSNPVVQVANPDGVTQNTVTTTSL